MAPVLNGDRNGNEMCLYNNQGFLTEDNCSMIVRITSEPLTDFYDVEKRPFAR